MALTSIFSPPTPPISRSRDSRPMINPLQRKQVMNPALAEREGRESFASFKEDRSAIAQSFIDSKTSSYARNAEDDEEAIEDTGSPAECHDHSTYPFNISVTNPQSQLHNGFICPCDGFRGWKAIPVGGRAASRSFSDLRLFSRRFSWEAPAKSESTLQKKAEIEAGQSRLEKLPIELLSNIVDYLAVDVPANGLQPRNVDLMSLLLTSRALHAATLATLYSQVTIPHSNVFRKFLAHITAHPSLGTIVRRMDFSHFNPTGAGWTARERAETQNLTPTTLLQCLELLPNLREFLAQEHIDEELTTAVLRKLFELPRLEALDFCASSSSRFRDAMLGVFRSSSAMTLPEIMPIKRLSFHGCTILPGAIFETILPRLPQLTHLDVTHTRITDSALASIPHTARLTHLSIAKCPGLTGEKVVEFLATHPAVKDTLVYLNLLMDVKSHEMFSVEDVMKLLPRLPKTLRSLNLKGSKMAASHVQLLLPLTKHLEELGLGRGLPYLDILSLVRPPADDATEDTTQTDTDKKVAPWTPHTLHYLDLSDTDPLAFADLFGTRTTLLTDVTLPLEVLEVGAKTFDTLKTRERICQQNGWVPKEAGRRGWLVRDVGKLVGKKLSSGEVIARKDDGRREWKMGASYWGMRKVPVARAEVGGMYGLYMFKR